MYVFRWDIDFYMYASLKFLAILSCPNYMFVFVHWDFSLKIFLWFLFCYFSRSTHDVSFGWWWWFVLLKAAWFIWDFLSFNSQFNVARVVFISMDTDSIISSKYGCLLFLIFVSFFLIIVILCWFVRYSYSKLYYYYYYDGKQHIFHLD